MVIFTTGQEGKHAKKYYRFICVVVKPAPG